MPVLERLFQPIDIGPLHLKNRLVMLPASTKFDADGLMTDRLKHFYAARAKGGAGLIILGYLSPADLSGTDLPGVSIHKDELTTSLRPFTEAIHACGSKVVGQLTLRYRWRKKEGAPAETVGPTADIVSGPGIQQPRELTVDEIGQIVDQFGDAARRAREAGFDGVEIMAGAGYQLNRFLSPLTNKRADKYGGSLENRMRILLEVIENVKRKAGADFALSCRFAFDEFMAGGNHLDESKQIAKAVQGAGVHFLVTYVGWHECPQPTTQSSVPLGGYVYLTQEVKRVVGIPVVASNRIKDPLMAEKILAEGKADLVGMCRALIADPDLPNKAMEGRIEDIRPCIACGRCYDRVFPGLPLECSVNPQMGYEAEYKTRPVSRPMKVLVVGGGPAGMEAARVAAERGHKVTLWEKKDRLGGQLLEASVPPFKGEVGELTRFLSKQIRSVGVNVELGKEATVRSVVNEGADAVILATGAVPGIPEIPGAHSDIVADPLDVLSGAREPGNRVVVIGGGLIGCEVADFFASKGRKVTITSRQDRLGSNMGPANRWVTIQRLKKAGVEVKLKVRAEEVTENGIRVVSEEQSQFIPADTVVMAGGMVPNAGLGKELEGRISSLYAVGDCSGSGTMRLAQG